MADYFTQTVLRQTIPASLISPLERLLLGQIFESEDHDGNIYYYASEAPAGWHHPRPGGPSGRVQTHARPLADEPVPYARALPKPNPIAPASTSI